MPKLIISPSRIEAAGNKPKIIDEYVGRVNTATNSVSIARMISPGGWIEPKQTPEFDEYTIVFKGMLRVTSNEGSIDVKEGHTIIVPKGKWVQYSTPSEEGAEYIAVCLPAFSPVLVHREN